jgi:hypothetical protein
MSIFKAYNDGFDAFKTASKYLNPYAIGSSEFDLYERGYFQALKRSNTLKSSAPRPHPAPKGFSQQVMRDARNHMRSLL